MTFFFIDDDRAKPWEYMGKNPDLLIFIEKDVLTGSPSRAKLPSIMVVVWIDGFPAISTVAPLIGLPLESLTIET